MKEKTIKTIEKEISFEKNQEKIQITVKLMNISDNFKIKDFLEIMFKEINESLF
ncbi:MULTISPECIES: hypothetical protein [Clostridium]|uniref:Uncharacterized protein n=1 Tax=Clostridium disporicum TaxID=84024 RepID=A0A174AIV3_9CLOT|nr:MULTISPECIES: hypothetical protein [Clostridium]CUN87396.1 Uncharacterised protein [Clostridium disporicum]